MATSIFLAKLIGPLALALGFGVLFNRDAVRAVLDEFIHNRAILFLAGLITFPAGLAIVLTHNVWVADWPVIITMRGLAHRHLRRTAHRRTGGHHPVRPPRLRTAERPAVRRHCLARARRRPHLLRLHPITNPQGRRPHEQARFPRRSRHPEGDHRADLRFAQDLHHAGRGGGPARAVPRDRARSVGEGAAGAGVRFLRHLHRRQRGHRRRAGPQAHARRVGARARRRRGIPGPPDQAGRQRQRQRQAPRAQLPEHAEADARRRRRAGHAARVRASAASSPRR